jgi:hypothetical protein
VPDTAVVIASNTHPVIASERREPKPRAEGVVGGNLAFPITSLRAEGEAISLNRVGEDTILKTPSKRRKTEMFHLWLNMTE